MKRLVLVLAFALLPAALFAQVADRDTLLAANGTLYTVESVANDGTAPAEVSQYLALTIQKLNAQPRTITVPGSLTSGTHWRPALAYDSNSDTLFVFWLRMPNAMSSELLLSAYSNGLWQGPLSIDSQTYHLRYNLRVAITRHVAQLRADGSYGDMPKLLIHAVWWEETGFGENARYGLFSVERGQVNTIELHDLDEFVDLQTATPATVDANFNREILRHPAIVDGGTQDSIDVVFGNIDTNNFNRVHLRPIADGRIHIPIGAHPGGPSTVVPKSFTAPWTGPISTIVAPHDGGLLLYNTTRTSVNYIVFSDGEWSQVKSLALSDKLSADAAVTVLSRMMTQ